MIKKLLVPLLLLIAALGMIGFGIYTGFFRDNGYADVTAVITNIESERDYSSDDVNAMTHTVTVRFEVDGQEYSGILDTWEDGYELNKEINIKYNPSNPADFHGESGGLSTFLIIGGVVLAIIVVFAFLRGKFTR